MTAQIIQMRPPFETGNLLGRAKGNSYRKGLCEAMEESSATLFALSFDTIEIMDVLFADACFLTFALTPIPHRKLFYLSNMNISVAETLRVVLEHHAHGRGIRNCCLPQQILTRIETIGKAERTVDDTLALLDIHKKLEARELAHLCQLSINASSFRLKTLYDLGLCTRKELRDESGKHYIYKRLLED